jgi:hypothetical protein
LNLDPTYQILWQIKQINQNTERFLNAYTPDYMKIAYEDLCEKPNERLGWIADRFDLKRKCAIPVSALSLQDKIKISDLEWQQILEYASLLYDKEIPVN